MKKNEEGESEESELMREAEESMKNAEKLLVAESFLLNLYYFVVI